MRVGTGPAPVAGRIGQNGRSCRRMRSCIMIRYASWRIAVLQMSWSSSSAGRGSRRTRGAQTASTARWCCLRKSSSAAWRPSITVLLNNDEYDVLPIVPAGTKLWRVRPHDHPDPEFVPSGKELGSAPETAARNNRFSPDGVSMFYGSDELETALLEVDYSTCPYATAGQFQTMKDLVLLDLTDVKWFPSIFDPAEARYYYEADFIRGFGDEIRRPLEKDEDYRPTQRVVAEGILRFSEPIDGIRFKSAKHSERYNYVLFFGKEACGDLGAGDEAVLALDLGAVETMPIGGVSSSEPDGT